MRIPRQIDVDRLAVEKGGLYAFMRLAWAEVEGAVPFVPGWHLEEVCAHLEAVTRGECKELVISMPPGTSKSSTISVFWHAWEWTRNPAIRWMYTSFDPSLSQRDALKCKGLIQSDWYQARWGIRSERPVVLTAQDDRAAKRQDGASVFWNTSGGLRFSTSMLGKATGWHVHRQIADDPVKPSMIQEGGPRAIAALEKCLGVWDGTFSTRKVDPSNFSRVVMMQRLHELDLAGVCIERGYHALVLPMEFDSRRACVTPWGRDRREKDGDLLCPERFDAEAVATGKRALGSAAQVAAQYQQDPAPEGGSIYRREWFNQTYRQVPAGARWLISLDATFKDGDDSDYCVFQVWAGYQGKIYLIDEIRDRMNFPTTLATAERLYRKYPQVKEILIEDKANGSGIIQTLKATISGVIGYSPDVSKEARASAASVFWEAGDVHLPEREFVAEFIEEHIRFPRGRYDDRVDCANQAILRLTDRLGSVRRLSRLEKAMSHVS